MDEGWLPTKGAKTNLPAKSVLAADSKVNSVSGSLCHDGCEEFTRKYASMKWGSFIVELDGMGWRILGASNKMGQERCGMCITLKSVGGCKMDPAQLKRAVSGRLADSA